MSGQYFLPAATVGDPTITGGDHQVDVVITPESAGWGYSSLRVLTLTAGVPVSIETGDHEMILLPLSGAVEATCDGERLELAGRTGVFDAVTDFAYLPRDSTVRLESLDGGQFALPGAKADRRLPFRYGPAAEVSVELRGAGTCSRQVNNFATPATFETDKMIAVEVLTPAANWSSYPPHKHDETSDVESNLEEVYWYAFRSQAPAGREAGPGVGYQRVYGTAERPIEILEEVSDGDTILVPHGWHGPSMAAPSHDMYYLNVMAGPEPTRAWKICDDPVHGWVRSTWADQPMDPRLPFYTAPAAG